MVKTQKIEIPLKIDLHVHTSEGSPCGKATAGEMVEAAIAAGLDALIFTDHDKLFPKRRINQLYKKYAPFRIFGGIEVSIQDEHIIVLGIYEKQLETKKWTYPELHKYCRKNNGYMILCHPYRFYPFINVDIKNYPPDAVEVYSANTPLAERHRIVELANLLDLTKLSNSDAHMTKYIGMYYNILDRTPFNEQELIDILRQGDFTRAALERD